MDLDDDGDGLLDNDEWDWNLDGIAPDDSDADGVYNFLDTDQSGLSMPNAFSPNGDNINDMFVIPGIGSYPNNKFSVFNRWGIIVFEQNNYTNSWDGKSTVLGGIGGDALPVGTYFYVLDLGNGNNPMSGFIYLNR